MGQKVILDVDPGIDDSLAILLALNADEIDVVGITVVSGNIEVNQATKNALKAVQMAGEKRPPVYKGAALPLRKEYVDATDTHGVDGIGENFFEDVGIEPNPTFAVDFIIETVDANPGDITILALGPLTNIALAIEKAPEIMKKVQRIIIMGGAARFHGNCSPVAEYNFWVDPDAAKAVFGSNIAPMTMIGLDVTHHIILSPNLREVLNQLGTERSKYIYDITRFYVDFHWMQERTIGCVINDPLVPAILLDPSIIETRQAYVEVETEGLAIGQSLVDFGGIWHEGMSNAEIAMKVNPKRFFEVFFGRLFPEHQADLQLAIDKQYWGEEVMLG